MTMVKARPFTVALCISLSCHLFLMFFVTVVVVPKSFQRLRVYTVSFLGPILEKTAFELMFDEKARSENAQLRQPLDLGGGGGSAAVYAGGEGVAVRFESLFPKSSPQPSDAGAYELSDDFKFLPPAGAFGHAIQEARGSGDIREDREVVFKPVLPTVPRRTDLNRETFAVGLKFKVLPSGAVDDVMLVASSGYPDIDIAAIDYVKGTRYAPLDSGVEQQPMWYTRKVNLKSR